MTATRRTTISAEGVAKRHRAQSAEANMHEEFGIDEEPFLLSDMAKDIYQRVYPGVDMNKKEVIVLDQSALDYKTYDALPRNKMSFGEVHVVSKSENLSENDIDKMFASMYPVDDEDTMALGKFFEKVEQRVSDYYPAGLTVLYKILQDPEKYANPPYTFVEKDDKILFPGVLFCNPVGIWCVPMISFRNKKLTLEFVTLREVVSDKFALYLTS